MGKECQRCGKPGEVFYYQGVEVTLCGDCLEYLDEIVKQVNNSEVTLDRRPMQGSSLGTPLVGLYLRF